MAFTLGLLMAEVATKRVDMANKSNNNSDDRIDIFMNKIAVIRPIKPLHTFYYLQKKNTNMFTIDITKGFKIPFEWWNVPEGIE